MAESLSQAIRFLFTQTLRVFAYEIPNQTTNNNPNFSFNELEEKMINKTNLIIPKYSKLVGHTVDRKADVWVIDGKVVLTKLGTRQKFDENSIVSFNWHGFCEFLRNQNVIDSYYIIPGVNA
jgi:hypothetical protein